MKTAHRLASHAKRLNAARINAVDLPKFWKPKLTETQKLDCQLIHWDLISRFTAGTADKGDLWDWAETGLTYSRFMYLIYQDGTQFTPEAQQAVDEQLQSYEAVIGRFMRTGRVGFTGAELLIARAAASVFDGLVALDRNGFADQAAHWSVEQMRGGRVLS